MVPAIKDGCTVYISLGVCVCVCVMELVLNTVSKKMLIQMTSSLPPFVPHHRKMLIDQVDSV